MSMIQIHSLDIPPHVLKDLQIMAADGAPNEVCGVLHSHNIIHQYPNTFAGDHKLGFDMEVDIHDGTIKAIWHSHPGGLSEPSRDDLVCIKELASHGYNYPWIIVTSKDVTQWLYVATGLLAS